MNLESNEPTVRLPVLQIVPILFLAACATNTPDFFFITSLIKSDMEVPRYAQEGLSSISIDEEKIYVFTKFDDLIPGRTHYWELEVLDGRNHLVGVIDSSIRAKSSSEYIWAWYDINPAIDATGLWQVRIFIDGYLAATNQFEVVGTDFQPSEFPLATFLPRYETAMIPHNRGKIERGRKVGYGARLVFTDELHDGADPVRALRYLPRSTDDIWACVSTHYAVVGESYTFEIQLSDQSGKVFAASSETQRVEGEAQDGDFITWRSCIWFEWDELPDTQITGRMSIDGRVISEETLAPAP